ncbi:MAG: tail fiber domain-containing protein, partial [Candidatus Erginobacter occultus]|nr:tail fiber domain-containing protein [Candidatus Erginobacter occultus]
IFRPTAGATAGRWMIRGITRFGFGVANDTPLTGGNPMWNIPNCPDNIAPKLKFADTGGNYNASIYMNSDNRLFIENLADNGGVRIYSGVVGCFEIMNGITGPAFSIQSSNSIAPGATVIHTLTGSGTVYHNNGVLTDTDPSSADYKEDIKPIDLQAERILKLEPKTFAWKETGKQDFGYIAEEVREVVPELYRDNGRIKGYDLGKLSFYLTEVVKAQDKRLAALEEEIKTLKAQRTAGE